MTETSQGRARIGVSGLDTMGRNLARNLARHGYTVAVQNRTTSKMTAMLEQFGDEGDFVGCETLEDLVAAVERPRSILVMVKAGAPTDAVIDALVPLLDEGDIVIDGGNAHFEDTRRREATLRDHGIHFVGAGVSGGEEGALHGPSIMPGGSEESYRVAGPMLESIAARVDGTPCTTYIGPDGSGHFVKMVHNGIEYADMQFLGEAYDILRTAGGMAPREIADVFERWNDGPLGSFLVEIAITVLRAEDGDSGKPLIDVIQDAAEQKGTGRWTVQIALELGVPVSAISEAVFARSTSGHVEQRKPAQEVLTGPDPLAASEGTDRDQLVADLEHAVHASRLVAYAQGFDLITAGSVEYGWDVDRAAVATIWRGGCIIRAKLLETIRQAYDRDAELPTLLVDPHVVEVLTAAQDAWRRTVATAATAGVPVAGIGTALSAYDSLRAQRSPAALLQGLRDLFGAHSYRRIDREGSFHRAWAEDGAESPV